MSKTVSFGMFWQMYGTCVVDLPDSVDETNSQAVLNFIQDKWDDFPLPVGSYVLESDELDYGADITVDCGDGRTISHGSPDEIEEGNDEDTDDKYLVGCPLCGKIFDEGDAETDKVWTLDGSHVLTYTCPHCSGTLEKLDGGTFIPVRW